MYNQKLEKGSVWRSQWARYYIADGLVMGAMEMWPLWDERLFFGRVRETTKD
jgi:hypothetical protein